MWRKIRATFRRQPGVKVAMCHPQLGEIEFHDEGWWTSTCTIGARPVEVNIAGDRGGPDPRQVELFLKHFPQYLDAENQARALLASQGGLGMSDAEPSFRIDSVDFIFPQKPDFFAICLSLSGDEYGVWRIEYDVGKPTYLTRDD
jgi:hypothetical protein